MPESGPSGYWESTSVSEMRATIDGTPNTLVWRFQMAVSALNTSTRSFSWTATKTGGMGTGDSVDWDLRYYDSTGAQISVVRTGVTSGGAYTYPVGTVSIVFDQATGGDTDTLPKYVIEAASAPKPCGQWRAWHAVTDYGGDISIYEGDTLTHKETAWGKHRITLTSVPAAGSTTATFRFTTVRTVAQTVEARMFYVRTVLDNDQHHDWFNVPTPGFPTSKDWEWTVTAPEGRTIEGFIIADNYNGQIHGIYDLCPPEPGGGPPAPPGLKVRSNWDW